MTNPEVSKNLKSAFMKEENILYGLAYDCPTQQRKDDCPFMQVERLSFIEKVNWIDGLNKDIKQKIIEQHNRCSNNSV